VTEALPVPLVLLMVIHDAFDEAVHVQRWLEAAT
jgi:hypothetical protein